MIKKGFGLLQRVGKSLMMPVSVLPAAGLLVALSRLMMQGKDASEITDFSAGFLAVLGRIFYEAGMAVFGNLPLIFAVGVAIGFAGGAGVAGLAAVIGYLSMTNVIAGVEHMRGLDAPVQTGVFGGIYMGLFSAYLYNKFHKTKLPQVLGFFSGKRLVPIITAFMALVSGVVLSFIWPPIQNQINVLGISVSNSYLGPSFYAAVKRALIPFGLHHVYYQPFLYEFGQFTTATGEVVHGEFTRYYAGDPTAGRFMASEYPMMLFGLPAACLAMWLRAKPHKKKLVSGIFLSGALTAIITGITEPIEFAFIFVAPLLFVVHIGLTFLSGMLTTYFGIRAGYTFSASLIDLVLSYFNAENLPYMVLVGLIIGALYFISFYVLIGIFDFKTPGREDDTEDDKTEILSASEKARKVLVALGGSDNIVTIDACITRLRLTVKEEDLVDVDALKGLGAAGVLKVGGGSVQAIFGTEAEMLKDDIKELLGIS